MCLNMAIMGYSSFRQSITFALPVLLLLMSNMASSSMFSEMYLNSVVRDEDIQNQHVPQKEQYIHNLRRVIYNANNVASSPLLARQEILHDIVNMRHASNSIMMHQEQSGVILTSRGVEVPVHGVRRHNTIARDGNVYSLGHNVTKEDDLAATREFLDDLVSFELNDDAAKKIKQRKKLSSRNLRLREMAKNTPYRSNAQHPHSHQTKPTTPPTKSPHHHHQHVPTNSPQLRTEYPTNQPTKDNDSTLKKIHMKNFNLLISVVNIIDTDVNQAPGSNVILESTVYAPSGKTIGRGFVTCTIVDSTIAQCHYAVSLKKDGVLVAELHFQAKLSSQNKGYIPISVTGGTGMFSGAKGSAYEVQQTINIPAGCGGEGAQVTQCVNSVWYVTLYEYYDHGY